MSELDEFEHSFDAFYKKTTLTTINKNLALWRAMTVFEDVAYLNMIVGLKSNKAPQHVKEIKMADILNKHKFHMKYILSRVNEECTDDTNCKKDVYFKGSTYKPLLRTYKKSESYRGISLAITSVRKGSATYEMQGKKITVRLKKSHMRHTVLEYSNYIKDNESQAPNHGFRVLMAMIQKTPSEIIEQINSSCRNSIHGNLYVYNDDVMNYIYAKHSHEIFDLPPEWVFPWGNLKDFRGCCRALSTICVYHIFMNNYSSEKFNIQGGGVEKRLLILSKNEILSFINKLTGDDISNIEESLNALTYGNFTKNPDPALQPLIIFNNKFILSTFNLTSLNFERNALSLHLRVSPKDFHKKSHVFEKYMLNKFTFSMRKRFHLQRNFFLENKRGGEIDVLLVDIHSKTIAVCELKWMLPPADPNEVLNKINEAHLKISQSLTKASECENQLAYILKRCNLESDLLGWKVYPFAIFDGFPGVESHGGDATLAMPMEMFFQILNSTPTLRFFCEFIRSGKWLPIEGIHYRKKSVNLTFGGKQIETEQIEMLDLAEYKYQFIPSCISDFKSVNDPS